MRSRKRDRENLLNLYITILNKEAIETIIYEKVESLKWEFYYKAKKIDIFGISDSGKSIFIENQIGIADERHLVSILEVIDKVPTNSTVIWGATGFSTETIKSIANKIHNVEDKKVDFYAVKINSHVIPILEKLDSIHVLKVMDNLPLLNALEIYNDIFDKYVSNFSEDIEVSPYRYVRTTDRERTNAYIIAELRNKVKYPNIYREKRTIDTNKIRYGFGRTGIDVEIINKNGDSYVSCQFTPLTNSIYREIVQRRNILETKIGKEVIFDDLNMRIYTLIEQFEHKFEKIDMLVDLMEKYIFYLSNYTFYFDTATQEQMWQAHREGLLEGEGTN